MAKPVRLQLSRKAGFNLQEHSRAVNGLPAKLWCCDRATQSFEEDVKDGLICLPWHELRDHNLACWCALPCHGQPDMCHGAAMLGLASLKAPDPTLGDDT